MNKEEILTNATGELEEVLDELWQTPALKDLDLNRLFNIHRTLVKLHEEGVCELKKRNRKERRNAIDLGELKCQ